MTTLVLQGRLDRVYYITVIGVWRISAVYTNSPDFSYINDNDLILRYYDNFLIFTLTTIQQFF